MIKKLLEEIENIDFLDYSEMVFNLYEDNDAYSIEVVFGDDALIIGCEEKCFVMEKGNLGFDAV